MFRRTARDEKGLTIIEVIAALTIFSIVTLGVVPLMLSSIKASSLSRSYTKGKNVAVEAMERVRGLPYFVSVGSVTPVTAPRVDILDLYFPDMAASGSSGYQSGKFITTCTSTSDTPSTSGTQACPTQVPAGHTVTFEATFVRAEDDDTFTAVTPSNYNWNSTSTETPPSQLLQMVIRVTWTQNGATRTSSLTSLIGQRDISDQKLRASADLDYVVQGFTGFINSDGKVSNLTVTAGTSRSQLNSRAITSADQTVEAGRLTLVQEEFGTEPAVTLADEFGALETLHAVPNTYLGPDVDAAAQTLTHPDLGYGIGYLGPTKVDDPGTKVETDLPAATGGLGFTGPPGQPSYWIANDPGVQGTTDLHLSATEPMLDLSRAGGSVLVGRANAFATALTPAGSRKVESTVSAQFQRVHALPTDFITDAGEVAVVIVRNFTASITCQATASAATAVATGSWSATLSYWADANPNDDVAAGGYVNVALSGSTSSTAVDPLAAIKASNPLVYDGPTDDKDIYLFKTGSVNGYLEDWYSRPQIQWSKDASGRNVTVDLDGALEFITVPVNPQVSQSQVAVTFGAMSCEAVDKRGL